MVEALRPSVPLWNSSNSSLAIGFERLAARLAGRHESAERLAALLQITHLDAVVGGPVERRLGDVRVRDGNPEAGAEGPQLLVVHLLLLVGDVLALARLAQPVALDRPRDDDGRRSLVLDGGLVGVVDLDRVVSAERQLPELVVGQVLDHVEQPRIDAPEMLAHVGARFDGVLLILAVDDLSHALHEQAVAILREQRHPNPAPEHLDDVPAGATERRFEFLDDLAVAADRAVEPLQVAVDDEDQVVELFARRQGDGAERFGLVGLAVAEERPDLGVRFRLEAAVFEIAGETRLVDGHQRAETHRHRGVFPEIGHQPGVRIRRQPAAGVQLAAEVFEVRLVEPAFEIGAGIDAGRGVPLKEDHVAIVAVVAAEEMIERDFVERRRRGERGDVAADPFGRLVGPHHHGCRVPAHEALDPALEVRIARHQRLIVGGDGIDVRRVRGERQRHAALGRVEGQLAEQPGDLGGSAGLQDIIKRLEPLAGFNGIELRRVFRSNVSHGTLVPSGSLGRTARATAGQSVYCNGSRRRRSIAPYILDIQFCRTDAFVGFRRPRTVHRTTCRLAKHQRAHQEVRSQL